MGTTMRSDLLRQPAKGLDRAFRSLGAERLGRQGSGVAYRFGDGGIRVVPDGVTPGQARAILAGVHERYGTRAVRSNADPLRSAVRRDDVPPINVDHLCMSKHATDRFELMTQQARLEGAEIADALRFPERVLWSPLHESWLWVRGRIIVAVVLDENGMTIIRTILWATEELWEQNPRPKEAP